MRNICQPRQSTHTIHTVRNPNEQSTISRTSKFRRRECTGTERNAVSNTIQLSIDNRTRRTQLGAPKTAAACPMQNAAPKHHHFNMGTATRTDQARISKSRQCDPTRTVWTAMSNATQWSIDNAIRKSSERATFAAGCSVKRHAQRGALTSGCSFGPESTRISNRRHRVKRHARNTHATFRSQFRLRNAQHLSTPTIETHHSHPFEIPTNSLQLPEP